MDKNAGNSNQCNLTHKLYIYSRKMSIISRIGKSAFVSSIVVLIAGRMLHNLLYVLCEGIGSVAYFVESTITLKSEEEKT